ncbi:aspartic and glutamic acid-rich protein-like [Branchiostoma floridae]|nr:aspartic and glutamic acid-rich protein-like [Branchiostoma floridae]
MEQTDNLKRAVRFYRHMIIRRLTLASQHTNTDVLPKVAAKLGDNFLHDLKLKKGELKSSVLVRHIVSGYQEEDEAKITNFCQILRHDRNLGLGLLADLIESYPGLRMYRSQWNLLDLLSQIASLRAVIQQLGKCLHLENDVIERCKRQNRQPLDKVRAILFYGLQSLGCTTSLAQEVLGLVYTTLREKREENSALLGLLEALRSQIDEWKDIRKDSDEQGATCDADVDYDDDFEDVSDSDDDGFEEGSYFSDFESDDSRGSEDEKKLSPRQNDSGSEGEIEECLDMTNKPVQSKERASESEEEIEECIFSDKKDKSLHRESRSSSSISKVVDIGSEEEIEECIDDGRKGRQSSRPVASSGKGVDSDSDEEIEECIVGSSKPKKGPLQRRTSPKPASTSHQVSTGSKRRNSNRGPSSAQATGRVRRNSLHDGTRGRSQRTVVLGEPQSNRSQTSRKQTGGVSAEAPLQNKNMAERDRETAGDGRSCHEGHAIRKLEDKVEKLEALIGKIGKFFPHIQGHETGTSSRPSTSMSRKVTEMQLSKLSQFIGNDWESLGRELGLKAVTLSQIKCENPLQVERVFNMLLKWKNRNYSTATVQTLYTVISRWDGVKIDALDYLNSFR